MRKIQLLYIFNFLWYLIIMSAILIGYYSYEYITGLKFITIIISILFTDVFIYSILFIWIISKSKLKFHIRNFFSTWGRQEIKSNIDEYFDKKYADLYRKIIKLSYVVFFINICLIISIPIYSNYLY